jgi:hypothetical protein
MYTLTLPSGWRVAARSSTTVVVLTADRRVQVQIATRATSHRPSLGALRQAIVRVARSHGMVKRVVFRTLTVGGTRGLQGTATYRNKPYALVVVALANRSGRHVVIVAVTIHVKATARDVTQARAIVAGLHLRAS